MKKLLILFVLLYSINLFAQFVDVQTAKKVAQNLYAERLEHNNFNKSNLFTDEVQTLKFNDIPTMYVFERNHTPGYIVVAADKRIYPIIAYSFESDLYAESMPPALNWWINQRSEQIAKTVVEKATVDEKVMQEWDYYLTNGFNKSLNLYQSVTPMLNSKWNQGCFYNELCPVDANAPEEACGRVWVGCVAISMGQIMKFHAYPEHGSGFQSYTHSKYGTMSVDFSEQTYNWDIMEESLTEPGVNQEVAKILHHCGIAVKMNYGTDGSGSQTVDAAFSLSENFKYSSYLSHQMKEKYPENVWAEILKEELRARRPLLYRGYNEKDGGHAFVCDGFQGNNHFHFDFGWGGAGNGYFYLDKVGGFQIEQGAIFSVEPPTATETQYCDEYKLLTAESGTIADNSGDNRYANETSCKWLIKPEGAKNIVLEFTKLATETGVDRILVYQGDSEDGELIADISGYQVPEQPIIVSGGSMFLWFITDELNMSDGWEAKYHSWMTDIEEYDNEVKIYPNPVQDFLNIEMQQYVSSSYLIKLQDIYGKTILHKTVNADELNHGLDISNIDSGVYFINIIDGFGKVLREKFIKL